MSPLEVRNIVAAAFDVSPYEIANCSVQRRPVVAARHVYWYLLVQATPRPETYTGKSGAVIPSRPHDGVIKPVARQLGVAPGSLRYGLAKVEDRREETAFDDLVSRLERQLGLI